MRPVPPVFSLQATMFLIAKFLLNPKTTRQIHPGGWTMIVAR